MADLETCIHTAIFPSFEIDDHSDERRWRNAKCDVQVVWAALWNRVDFLVTRDARIVARAPKLAAVRPIDVLTPPCFLRSSKTAATPYRSVLIPSPWGP